MDLATLDIVPTPAPRQVRSDTWNPSPPVQRYRAFRDQIRLAGVAIPNEPCGIRIDFFMPMPKSWSAKKRQAHAGRLHAQKPDLDNLVKAFLDAAALGGDDAHVARIDAAKAWTEGSGCIRYCWT